MEGRTKRIGLRLFLVLVAAAAWVGLGPGSSEIFAQSTGAVYTMTDASSGNEIMAYSRAADGTLTFIAAYSTEGLGSGNELFSQGSVTLSPDHQYLFVVNPNSNTITSFAVQSDGSLMFADVVSSHGDRPVSVTAFGNFLYVVNFSGSPLPNIVGYTIGTGGTLTEIPHSSRNLSNSNARPGMVVFNNTGTILAVAEKQNDELDTFTVAPNGIATGPLVQPSNSTPFAGTFDNAGHLIIAENVESTVSSYDVSSGGVLTSVSDSIPDGGKQACWIANTNSPNFPTQYSYVANTASANLSSFSISPTGALTLLNTAAGSRVTVPRDMAFSSDYSYIYVLQQAVGLITGFSISTNGSLTKLTNNISGLPITVYGLAGY